MARKRKKKTTITRRKTRSRMSGIGNLDMTGMMFSAAGGFGARLVDRIVPTTVDRKLVAGGKIALGFILPMLSKDAKTKAMLSSIGQGMVAVGTVDLVTALGIMTGLGVPPTPSNVEELAVAIEGIDSNDIGADVLGTHVLAASRQDRSDIPVINGRNFSDLPVLNGNDYQMQDNMLN